MAENKPTRRGGRYCVAGAPNQRSCKNTTFTPGITMHQFPSDPVIREKWVKFVQKHRHDFRGPSKYASLCSAHFEESCYTRSLALRLEGMENTKLNRILMKGSIPTRDTVFAATPEPLSNRRKRQLRREVLSEVNGQQNKRKIHSVKFETWNSSTCDAVCDATRPQEPLSAPGSSPDCTDDLAPPTTQTSSDEDTTSRTTHPSSEHLVTTRTTHTTCCNHKSKLQNSQRSNNRLKKRVMELKKTVKELQRKIPPDYETEDDSELPRDEDSDWTARTESTEDENTDAEMEDNSYNQVNVDSSTRAFNEPKFVFYSSLISIFSLFCFNCKEPKPSVTMKRKEQWSLLDRAAASAFLGMSGIPSHLC